MNLDKAEPHEPYSLCEPVPGETIEDAGLRERAQGCWLGQLAGDALGSMVEFQSAWAIRDRYPHGLREIGPSPVWRTLAGQPTDDSELALMLARTLLQDKHFDDEQIARAYGYWRRSRPFDIGGTIGQATRAIVDAESRGQSIIQAARAAANRGSEANGGLMRQSPLAIWGHALPHDELDRLVRRDTTLTHPSRVCQDTSAAFIVAVAATIKEGLDGEAAYGRALEWDQQHGESPTVSRALAESRHAKPQYESNQGHVLIALHNAFYQALHASSFEEGVVATVMGGGDTDTNAAIAGSLLGAIHGVNAIPVQWRQTVLSCEPLKGKPGVQQPRPRTFWPVDALCLAERLLVQGQRYAEQRTPKSLDPGQSSIGSQRDVAEPGRRERSSPSTGREPELTRFVGALLGGAVGDALGRPVEGWSSARIKERYGQLSEFERWPGWKEGPIGTVTDDTQLTMCVAECLIENGFLDPEDLARRFAKWLPHGRGKGKATTAAVRRLDAGVPWWEAGEDSAGNGAAMRAAPIGLLRWNAPRLLRTESILSALPTHRAAMGVAGAVAMAAATAFLVARGPQDWSVEEFIAVLQQSIVGLERGPSPERRDPSLRSTLHDRIGEIPRLLSQEPHEVFDRLYTGAYVLESLPAALYCFLRSPDDVEQMLVLAANAGHDTDTIGAMVGTLGGALGGVEALPDRLLGELEHRAELEALASRLFQLAMPG